MTPLTENAKEDRECSLFSRGAKSNATSLRNRTLPTEYACKRIRKQAIVSRKSKWLIPQELRRKAALAVVYEKIFRSALQQMQQGGDLQTVRMIRPD